VMQYLFDETISVERHAAPVNRIARQFEN
jgi:hypothetical protein